MYRAPPVTNMFKASPRGWNAKSFFHESPQGNLLHSDVGYFWAGRNAGDADRRLTSAHKTGLRGNKFQIVLSRSRFPSRAKANAAGARGGTSDDPNPIAKCLDEN
jgi:hypothetical protein